MTEKTYDLLEKAVQKQLEAVEEIETDTKEGKEALTKSIQLTELLVSVDRDQNDAWDKQEKRRIEEERNKASNNVEIQKQSLTWGRVGLELGKVVVPILVSFAGYNVFQKRILRFEETGRISSTAGRELHLPKFMK